MTPDDPLWQRLEADFAIVLGEIPRPVGPKKWRTPEQIMADKAYEAAVMLGSGRWGEMPKKKGVSE